MKKYFLILILMSFWFAEAKCKDVHKLQQISNRMGINKRIDNVIFNDSVEYTVLSNNQVEVRTINESYFTGYGEIDIPDTVYCGSDKFAVIGVGAYAFCRKLIKRVSLPKSIKYIKDYGFEKCPNLTNIELPDSLESIGNYAFQNCNKIKEFYIPDNVLSIGSFAFVNCISLERISFGGKLKSIGDYPFAVDNGYYNDMEKMNLKQVVFRDGDEVLNLGIGNVNVSFYPNSYSHGFLTGIRLDSLYLGRNVKYPYIENSGVNGKWNWLPSFKANKIEFGETVTSIPDKLFYNIQPQYLKLPPRLETIGESAFEGMKCLFDSKLQTELRLPSTLKKIGSRAFYTPYSQDKSGFKFFICEGSTPFEVGTLAAEGMLIVPDGCGAAYREALPNAMIVDLSDSEIKIKMTRAGRLEINLNRQGVEDLGTIYKLKVEGPLNDTDISVIGQQMKSLHSLDLSEAELTDIADNTFSSLGLINVSLPQNIETIGSNAFSMYLRCDSLVIPKSCTYIGKNAFLKSSIRKIIIESDDITIDNGAFQLDYDMEELFLNSGNAKICDYAFSGVCAAEVYLKGVQTAGTNSLYFKRLKKLVLDDVIGFNDDAFDIYCKSIEQILVHNRIPTGFGNLVSKYKNYIKDLRFLGDIEVIPDNLCSGLKALQSVGLHDGLKTIGKNSFNNCPILTELNIPESVVEIQENAFCNDSLTCFGALPDNIRFIGSNAFSNCKKLNISKLPDNLKKIQSNAFEGCPSVRFSKLPAGLQEIGDYAFSKKVIKADTLELPFSLERIGEYAIDMSEVNNVIAYWDNPIEVSKHSFGKPLQTYLYVPKNSWEKYDSADGWYWFADFIEFPKLQLTAKGPGNICFMNQSVASGLRFWHLSSGDNVNLDITPDDGYMVEYVNKNGRFITNEMESDNFFSQENLQDNICMEVSFVPYKRFGDANGDDILTLADVANTISYINEQEPESFIFYAADVNRDRRVSPIDINLTVDLVLGEPLNCAMSASQSLAKQYNGYEGMMKIENIDGRFALSLENTKDITAVQFDLLLPGKFDAESITLNSNTHSWTCRKITDDTVRFLIYSATNSILQADRFMEFSSNVGIDNISAENILATDISLKERKINLDVPTGIVEQSYNGNQEICKELFSLDGCRMKHGNKGVAIERRKLANGRIETRKAINK